MQRYSDKKQAGKKADFTALLVDAATLAMFATALDVVQCLVSDVQQAAQVIALDRVLFACDEFRLILERIQEAANTLEVLLVSNPSRRSVVVATHGFVLAYSLVAHTKQLTSNRGDPAIQRMQ